MGIEKDINSSNFRNTSQKAMVNIIYTSNWVCEKMANIFAKEGITQQQYNILRILKGSDKPLSTKHIRERMLDKMSDTSRLVTRLLAKRLVQKVLCSTDKRRVDITISEKGLKLLDKLVQHENDMDAMLANLEEAELETLNNLLDKIRDRKRIKVQLQTA